LLEEIQWIYTVIVMIKYELLSQNSTQIRDNNPFCFNNLNAFFCEYEISNVINPTHIPENKRFCSDKKSLKLILSIIKGCLDVIIIFYINLA